MQTCSSCTLRSFSLVQANTVIVSERLPKLTSYEALFWLKCLIHRSLSCNFIWIFWQNIVFPVASNSFACLSKRWWVENLLRVYLTKVHSLSISKEHSVADLLIDGWVVNKRRLIFLRNKLFIVAECLTHWLREFINGLVGW